MAGFADKGIGVYGQSVEETGVKGISSQGVGILGQSETSFGVHGEGPVGVHGVGTTTEAGNGRGGVFQSVSARGESPAVAQIQLVPALETKVPGKTEAASPTQIAPHPSKVILPGKPAHIDGLPPNGQAGDLLARLGEETGECTLWFCTRSRAGREPAHWRQVLLGSERIA